MQASVCGAYVSGFGGSEEWFLRKAAEGGEAQWGGCLGILVEGERGVGV
jgi:hypothetical protein